jgi:type VII secretion protein EccB
MTGSTTREDLQAHRFMNRRIRAALLEGDAESTARPLSRLGTGTYAGVFVTIALLAVVGIIGVLRPGGSTAWQQPGAFIVASETGARYVYLDGVLHPVVNYASAKLLLGNDLHVVNVSVRSLESAPHGPAIGIGMAPDSLPDATHVVGTDWSVCAIGNTAVRNTALGSIAGQPLRTAVIPGTLAEGTAMAADEAYLVRTKGGTNFLISSGHAFEIADEWLTAIGYQADQALPVGDDFVAALPSGAEIAPPEVSGLGQPGPPLPGSVDPVPVGSILADRVNSAYLMTETGLAALTPLQAKLLLADPRVAQAYGGSTPSLLPISQAQIDSAAVAASPDQGAGQPAPSVAPALAAWPAGEQQLCVRYGQQQAVPDIVVGPADPNADQATGLVQLPTGSGALIASRLSPGTPGTTVYLVTDTGMRYPVAGQKALEQLGLTGVSVAQLPPAVVELLPQGPLLDPAAAAPPAA